MPVPPDVPDGSKRAPRPKHAPPKVAAVVDWSARLRATAMSVGHTIRHAVRDWWESPRTLLWRHSVERWQTYPAFNLGILAAGVTLITILIALIDRVTPVPNPGMLYLPLAAMFAYYWNWYYGALTGLLDLLC